VSNALGDYANLTTENSFSELQTFNTGIYTQYIEAPTPDGVVGLYTGQASGGNITIGCPLVETTIDGTLKATTPLTNTNNTVVATTAWVNTWFQTLADMANYLTTATAASTYQTLIGMSGYLTVDDASATYQTLAGMSAYLTTATASSTYQTIADMANYLTTTAASSTYQTLAGMSAYLTTAAASSTYQTLAGMSAYGAKATTNTWDLLQTFTVGVNTSSISFATAATAASIYNTTTGIVNLATTSSEINIGNFRFTANAFNRAVANNDISIGDGQTGSGANLNLGTAATRAGPIAIGNNSCAVNVGGILNAQQGFTLSADKRITFATNTANPTSSSTLLGSVYSGTYIGGSTTLTSGTEFVESQITLVPIGVYAVSGCCSFTGVSANWQAFQPTLQIKNATATTYHASTTLPTTGIIVDTAGAGRISPTCSGIMEVTAVSTIQLVLTVTFTSPAVRNTSNTSFFTFKLVRIG
jgi:hypothetical protein